MSTSNTSINSFVPLMKLGEGTFSSVYKVRRISDNGLYALKKIKIACLKQKQKANALNQIRILASLTSSYIITYKQAFFDEKLNLLCIVMEWANDGDLLIRINEHKQKKKCFPEHQIWKAAYHILSGLRVLHRNSILHRDMKSANIFICDGIYKLGDLNVSKVNDHQQRLVKTQTGTPFYASPQIWRDQPYGSQSDIWSFGCILYQMCCLKPPFYGKDLNQLYRNVQKGEFDNIPKVYSKELEHMIISCLQQKAKDRPSAQQLLKDNGPLMSRCEYYEIAVEKQKRMSCSKQKLLSTIKMPTDMKRLNSHLPESKYKNSEEVQPEKTTFNRLKSPYLINKKQQAIKQINSATKMKTQKSQPVNATQAITSNDQIHFQKDSQIPLPQRIKNHLNSLNRLQPQDKLYQRKNYQQSKQKIHSSITNERSNILEKKIQKYLTPLKDNQFKKKRPLSCNYLPNKPVQSDKKAPYLVNLNRPQSGVPAPIYQSDRRAYIGNRQEREFASDRKNMIQDSRDPYGIRIRVQKDNKYRCRSANYRQPSTSAFNELKQRLEQRYRNIKPSGLYPIAQKSSKIRQQIRIDNNINHAYPMSLSYLPSSMSAHIYRNPLGNRPINRYKNESNSYLQQIQNKIISSAHTKAKRCDNIISGKCTNLIESDSHIRRMIKGQNIFSKNNSRF